MRHDRIIDLLGGNRPLGRLVGRSDSAVSRWRVRGIPPNYWPLIVRLAIKLGKDQITYDALAVGPPARRVVQYQTKELKVERVA